MPLTTPPEADYIIIGGGTSGLVLASRLSVGPNTSILVLEAGKDLTTDPRIQIPALWTTLMGSDADYQFTSTPQAPLKNWVIKIPQGKVLGGSSATNGMAFIAPLSGAIDAWSELGAKGWNWESLKGYYKKSYTLQLPDVETRRHIGVGWADEDGFEIGEGPLRASFPAVKENPLAKAWVETFHTIGNLALTDMATKTRSYAASAYGVSAVERGFRVLTEAVVKRVLFEGSPSGEEGGVASGVEVVIDGHVQNLKAKKEVLLCAGAINTPKILELSGIGDEERLRKHDIPVLVNNPHVGENLQDHLSTGISFEAIDSVVTLDPLLRQEPEAIQSAMQQYTESKTGPMTIGGIQSSAFMPILDFHASNKNRTSTMQDFVDPYLSTSTPDPRNTAIRNVLSKPDSPACMITRIGNFITLGFETNFSFSRGNTHITSSNPDDKPTLNPAYLTHPLDLDLMAHTLLDVHSLHKLPPLSNYLKPEGRRNHPDAFLSDLESAKKYLLDTVNTTYHYCGTAAMLPKDKGGVVDEELRVYGIRNLRICDASVFPLIPAANIQSSVFAVAERGADIIKEQFSSVGDWDQIDISPSDGEESESVLVPREQIFLPVTAKTREVRFFGPEKRESASVPAGGSESQDEERGMRVLIGSQIRSSHVLFGEGTAHTDDGGFGLQVAGEASIPQFIAIRGVAGSASMPAGLYKCSEEGFGGWVWSDEIVDVPTDRDMGRLDLKIERFDVEEDC
ncbi:hypothetical protein BDV12DRAFT_202619 [Aspergillus spectabilis]